MGEGVEQAPEQDAGPVAMNAEKESILRIVGKTPAADREHVKSIATGAPRAELPRAKPDRHMMVCRGTEVPRSRIAFGYQRLSRTA